MTKLEKDQDKGGFYEEVTFTMPKPMADLVRQFSRRYRTNFAGMMQIIVAYYFGDGRDHLLCEECEKFEKCTLGEHSGLQTTIPLLDKGMVVVGQPVDDLGKCERG